MWKLITIIIGVLLIPFSASADTFAMPCTMNKNALVRVLNAQENVFITYEAIGYGDTLWEIFINKDQSRWALTLTYPDGRICLMATGTTWEKAIQGTPL